MVDGERGLNVGFREQVGWFRNSEARGGGGREVVFWAVRKGDLELEALWGMRVGVGR